MKKTLLITTMTLLSAFAQAQEAKPGSWNAFRTELLSAADILANGGDSQCTFTVKNVAVEGYQITLDDGTGATVSVFVKAGSAFKYKTLEDADGSYEHLYITSEQTSVTFTHAYDAYFRVSVSDGKTERTCEQYW